MRYTATPGVTPQRHATFETAARADRIGAYGEADAKHQIEQTNRQRRGYEVATALVNLSIAKETHLQAHIKLGVTQLNTEITRQDFKRTAWNLAGKRAGTAIAEDNARSTVAEHGLNQTSIRGKLEGLELNTVEVRAKNQDKRTEMTLNGTLSRFSLGHAAT